MSKKLIKLTFLLKVFDYENDDESSIVVNDTYDNEMILNDILVKIYHKYSKNIYNKDEVGPEDHCILIYEPNLFEKVFKWL